MARLFYFFACSLAIFLLSLLQFGDFERRKMEREAVLRILEKTGALMSAGHFVYTFGKHGSTYINKDAIYSHPIYAADLALGIAEKFLDADIDIVVGPESGGAKLAAFVAYRFSLFDNREDIRNAFADKAESGEFEFRRGYERLIPGKRVLVVDDILNTGGTARLVSEVVRGLGGEVVGVGAICNRGSVTVQDVGNVSEVFTLIDLPLEAWNEDACPLCRQGIPVNTEVGKGREFLARKQRNV